MVRGTGRGGRNQEFALAAARAWPGAKCAFSVPEPTESMADPAAGAFVDGQTLERARRLAIDPRRVLLNNDSYAFFDALQDLFAPGPTGTNVMDIKIALYLGSAPTPLCYRTDVQSAGYVSEIFVSFQGEGLYAGRRQLFLRMGGVTCVAAIAIRRTASSGRRTTGHSATGPSWNRPIRSSRPPGGVHRRRSERGRSGGRNRITGGEPLLQADFLHALLANFQGLPRPVLLETSGRCPNAYGCSSLRSTS